MTTRKPSRKQLTEDEIDQFVIDQADEETAWEPPVRVHRDNLTTLAIPAELAARAKFFAHLHRTHSLEEWLTDIIRERVELEEAVFQGVKRDLMAKAG